MTAKTGFEGFEDLVKIKREPYVFYYRRIESTGNVEQMGRYKMAYVRSHWGAMRALELRTSGRCELGLGEWLELENNEMPTLRI